MKVQLIAIATAMLVVGCSKPTETIIPTDMSRWDKELAPVVKKLPEEDQRLLAAYIARAKMTELLSKGGEGIPLGTTIGSAIAAQKKWQADQVAKAEEERLLKERLQREMAEARAALDKSVTVALISLDRISKDYSANRFTDKQEFTIGVSNKTAEPMSGVSGSLEFVDIFDKVVGSVGFSITETIAPGGTVRWQGTRDYNQFIPEHRAVWSLESGKYTTRFVPRMIVFSDGRRLTANSK